MSCTPDVDVQAPSLVTHKGVRELQECANLCRANSSCATFVHNRYGACYLRRHVWDRSPVILDASTHETVSCVLPERMPTVDIGHLRHHLNAVRSGQSQERITPEALPRVLCWMLVRLESRSDMSLLQLHMQEWRHSSLRACTWSLILSNASATRFGDVQIQRAVKGALEVPRKGGRRWKTGCGPLCVPMFQQCWRAVAKHPHFAAGEWVVKLDPDTVFFAMRLRRLLAPLDLMRRASEATGRGLYLHNAIANWGPSGSPMTVFWGAIHVLSQQAFARLAARPRECERKAEGGEDWWVDSCMKALGVRHVYMERVLWPYGGNCRGRGRNVAALHPYKSVRQAAQCHCHNKVKI